MGLFKGFGEVVRHLNGVGFSTRVNPFVCPLVAEFRQNAIVLKPVVFVG